MPDTRAAAKWFLKRTQKMCVCGHYKGAHPDGPCEYINTPSGPKQLRRVRCGCPDFQEDKRGRVQPT